MIPTDTPDTQQPPAGTACHAYNQSLLDHVRKVFTAHTAEHELTVLADRSLDAAEPMPYRHLRLAQPGTSMYHWEIVTWPGHLSTVGDIADGYTFSRVYDMVDFFTPAPEPYRINPGYWAEKLGVGCRAGTTVFDEQAMVAAAIDALDISRLEGGPLSEWAQPCYDMLRDEVRRRLATAMGCGYSSPADAAYEFMRSWEYTPEQLAADLDDQAPSAADLPKQAFSFDRIGEDYELIEQAKVYDFHLMLAMHAIVFGLERYREHRARVNN